MCFNRIECCFDEHCLDSTVLKTDRLSLLYILLLDENQRICSEVFPTTFRYVQQNFTDIELIRPIASFISLTVAGNGKLSKIISGI